MKAVLCKTFGLPETLVVEDVSSPVATQGKVVISVKACGVNFPDTLIIQGKYQIKPPMPFSPGGEVSGIIKEVGERVSHLKVGDKVFSLTGFGGFAEEVVADAKTTLRMPEGMDFITASSVMYTYGTSYHALKNRAVLQAGETLLVLGAAGGVGLAAVELGKIMGARVIAAASTDEKLELCKQYGASEVINYSTEDLRERIKQITAGKGVDVIYDPVGGAYTEPAFRSIAWKGRYLVVGFAAGDIPNLPLNLPLLKGASVVGVFWGAFASNEPQQSMQNFQELLGFIANGNLKPHVHAQYPLEQAPTALNEILNRKVMGKVVVSVQ
ncbi:MAG: NADPH:quinone oxidoreductase family protein [Arcicella sp.]|jgi:NADPH2:quinone reductase|nr:NADPH:quinone oxidoreductase family protein [Arcicella sp.]